MPIVIPKKRACPRGMACPTHEEWDNFHNLMISIYGAEYAKAVSSQFDLGIQNTPGTEKYVSGFP